MRKSGAFIIVLFLVLLGGVPSAGADLYFKNDFSWGITENEFLSSLAQKADYNSYIIEDAHSIAPFDDTWAYKVSGLQLTGNESTVQMTAVGTGKYGLIEIFYYIRVGEDKPAQALAEFSRLKHLLDETYGTLEMDIENWDNYQKASLGEVVVQASQGYKDGTAVLLYIQQAQKTKGLFTLTIEFQHPYVKEITESLMDGTYYKGIQDKYVYHRKNAATTSAPVTTVLPKVKTASTKSSDSNNSGENKTGSLKNTNPQKKVDTIELSTENIENYFEIDVEGINFEGNKVTFDVSMYLRDGLTISDNSGDDTVSVIIKINCYSDDAHSNIVGEMISRSSLRRATGWKRYGQVIVTVSDDYLEDIYWDYSIDSVKGQIVLK